MTHYSDTDLDRVSYVKRSKHDFQVQLSNPSKSLHNEKVPTDAELLTTMTTNATDDSDSGFITFIPRKKQKRTKMPPAMSTEMQTRRQSRQLSLNSSQQHFQ